MATIARQQLNDLTDELNALSEEGKSMVLNALDNAEWGSIEELRTLMVEVMEQVCGTVTDMAAARTADFYDAVRIASVGVALGAKPLSGRVPEATEGAVRAGIQSVVETGTTEQFGRFLTARVDYEVKRSSGECMYRNGARDPLKPRYARVPSGAETCSFCIMLASRGFVYHNERAAGGDGHYHANCDCRIVPGFGGKTTVDGYDTEQLYDQYMEGLKRGQSNSKQAKSSVKEWSSEKFESYGDFARFVKSAETIEELQERCAVAAVEWANTGLGDKYWNQLKAVVFARRKEIEKIVEKLAEP